VATILNRWHRPRRGPDAGPGRPDPTGALGAAAGFTRTWVVLMVGLLAFAAASAVVILAR
jgi:hypothetical protein